MRKGKITGEQESEGLKYKTCALMANAPPRLGSYNILMRTSLAPYLNT